ncbi:MAG: hypothetical protein HY842_10045 [Bacteroidetes bacterium]|nr:hypothetical protein [Bacteroidota bacterium]
MFLLFDLIAVPEIYETLMDFVKWQTRPLFDHEKILARSVFGESIHLGRVRVDESAKVMCKGSQIIYVSYYTINAWGRFRPDIMIHELMHVWQFERLGGAYIPRALRAQKAKEGYNYGGAEALSACMVRGGGLSDFNLEQQADIVSDYFCIREEMMPAWGNGTRRELAVYEYFVSELKK